MSRFRIKICGITRPEDAALAADLGADAVGMVFVPDSSRCVSDTGRIREILASLPPLTTAVGLFFNQPQGDVEPVLHVAPEITLQFQGEELPDFCGAFGRPYIKGVRMAPDPAPATMVQEHADSAAAFLFDAWRDRVSGGTGETFDWRRLASVTDKTQGRPWLLAGGLHSGNVAEAAHHAPWGLDLASGVEKQPGIKDADKLRAFFRAVAALN